MTPQLGLIEGYYGKLWSWQAREETIAFLKLHGYDFYIYAPKADPYLRKRWREDHPADEDVQGPGRQRLPSMLVPHATLLFHAPRADHQPLWRRLSLPPY